LFKQNQEKIKQQKADDKVAAVKSPVAIPEQPGYAAIKQHMKSSTKHIVKKHTSTKKKGTKK
jgi:hypothetical protein